LHFYFLLSDFCFLRQFSAFNFTRARGQKSEISKSAIRNPKFSQPLHFYFQLSIFYFSRSSLLNPQLKSETRNCLSSLLPANSMQDELVIEPGRSFQNYWRDLWRYRELFYILAWRDVAVRYKQTVAGAAWALVQPFASMVIMTVVFGKVAGLPSEGNAPYAIMVYAAMLPWQFFANALSSSSQSIVSSSNLISKVYFPRLIIPGSSVVVSFVDFLVSCSLLFALMAWFQFWPTWRVLVLPVFVALAILAALGPGLILTALTVRYRDFRFIIPFIVQFGLFVSPVAYSSAVIRDKFGETIFLLYSLNPMVGVIDGFRWALLRGDSALYWPGFLTSVFLTAVLFISGLLYFRKTERAFADVI
jgi:lipopolysaccharide transport system permease protein